MREAGSEWRLQALQATRVLHQPQGGVRAFDQKSTCLTQSTLGPDVVTSPSKSGGNELLVFHRAEPTPGGAAASEAHSLIQLMAWAQGAHNLGTHTLI